MHMMEETTEKLKETLVVRGATDGTATSGTFALTISPEIVHSITNYAYGANPNYIVIPINSVARIKKITVTGGPVTVDVKLSLNAHTSSPTFTTIATYAYDPSVDGQLTLEPEIIIRAQDSINNLGKVSSVAIRFDWTQTTAAFSFITVILEIEHSW